MGYSASQAKAFIDHIAPIIKAEADRRGYAICSTVIAQAIIEGAAGTSGLAKNFHNHFGMKCGSSYKGKSVNMKTKEEYDGNLVTIKDNFRAYDSDEEGICGKGGYYDFISTKRYANLKNAANYKQYAEYLKADGWATSSSYVNTLCSTVKKYNLYVWDDDVRKEYYPQYTGNSDSIVEALDSLGIDSSRENRKNIYIRNFMDDYRYSAKQNTAMIILLKQGILIKP